MTAGEPQSGGTDKIAWPELTLYIAICATVDEPDSHSIVLEPDRHARCWEDAFALGMTWMASEQHEDVIIPLTPSMQALPLVPVSGISTVITKSIVNSDTCPTAVQLMM